MPLWCGSGRRTRGQMPASGEVFFRKLRRKETNRRKCEISMTGMGATVRDDKMCRGSPAVSETQPNECKTHSWEAETCVFYTGSKCWTRFSAWFRGMCVCVWCFFFFMLPSTLRLARPALLSPSVRESLSTGQRHTVCGGFSGVCECVCGGGARGGSRRTAAAHCEVCH